MGASAAAAAAAAAATAVAAAAADFFLAKAKIAASCIKRYVIYSILQNLLYRGILIISIDSKRCFHCSCSCNGSQAKLVKTEN